MFSGYSNLNEGLGNPLGSWVVFTHLEFPQQLSSNATETHRRIYLIIVCTTL